MVANKKKFSLLQKLFKHYPHPNNLEEYRLDMGISQEELADRVKQLGKQKLYPKYKISQETINAIETYRYLPTLELMMLISEVINKDREVIFDPKAEID